MPARRPARKAVELKQPCSSLYFAGGSPAPMTQALGAPRLSPGGAGLVPGDSSSSLPIGMARMTRLNPYAAGYPAVGSPLLGTLATTLAATGEPGRSAISRNAASSSSEVTLQ